MRRLKLNVEALKVESLTVASPGLAEAGTVHGRGEPDPVVENAAVAALTVGTCIGPSYCCPATWKPSCADTCLWTCPYSCDTYCFP